ncbi:MAG TPA: class I SAM-dependent methyltransferase [Nitrososphaerales archaeon]|nr:class I SAM-dependent methyltransferase [Nitrososphaerales archaeon]
MSEDEFAKALLSHERRKWQDPLKILAQLDLHKGMHIADLGCGPGYFTIPFAKSVGAKGIVYAIDSSQVMLSYLDSNIERSKVERKIVRVFLSDITKTDIPSSSVDLVFLANILHDISHRAKLFSEIRRISKEGAKLVVVEWKKEDTGFGPEVGIRLGEHETKQILKENGYVFRKIEAGPYHYGLSSSLFGKNERQSRNN